MTTFTKNILVPVSLFAACVLVPGVSHASTTSEQARELSSELSQITAQLSAEPTVGVASFTLSPGQSIRQATSTSVGNGTGNGAGTLSLSFPNLVRTIPLPSSTQVSVQLAKINLTYLPSAASSTPTTSSAFPVMTSELALGQSTNYLTYNISLSSLSSTSATFIVTDSAFLSSIQSEIDAVAVRVHALLNTK